MRRGFRSALLVLVAGALLASGLAAPVGAASTASSAALPGPGVALSVAGNGTLSAVLTANVTNGSALRYAMDGNFTPLIDALGLSASERSSLLADLNATETLFPGLFGNRDGTVSSVEVTRFESLLLQNVVPLVPTSTIAGVVNVTVDGQAPTADRLTAVLFVGAEGKDTSPAPIDVQAGFSLPFASAGTGAARTLRIGWNLPSIVGNLTTGVGPVNFSLRTPRAVDVRSTSGLSDERVANDPLGWGSGSVSGEFVPTPGHTVTVVYGPAFPTGTVLVVGLVAVAVAAIVLALVWRSRRRRRAPPAPAPAAPATPGSGGLGPSSGSP